MNKRVLIEDVVFIQAVGMNKRVPNYCASVCFWSDEFAGMGVVRTANYHGVTLKISLKSGDALYVNAEQDDSDLLFQMQERVLTKVKAANGISVEAVA